MLDDGVGAGRGADVFGGEVVLDEITAIGGLRGSVDVLGEVGGGFGFGVGGWRQSGFDSEHAGAGGVRSFAGRAFDLEGSGEGAGIIIGVADGAAGLSGGGFVAKVEDVVGDGLVGSGPGAGEGDLEWALAGERAAGEVGTGEGGNRNFGGGGWFGGGRSWLGSRYGCGRLGRRRGQDVEVFDDDVAAVEHDGEVATVGAAVALENLVGGAIFDVGTGVPDVESAEPIGV